MRRSRRHSSKQNLGLRLLILVAFAALVTFLASPELIEDGFNLPTRPPSPEIEQLARATTMTPLGQRLFYRQDPEIEPRETFLTQCEAPEQTIVLGCYMQQKWGDRVINGKIIIQQIDDPQFQGIMEVTAAHEMLHVAYEKLSRSERKTLLQHLEPAAERITDKRLLKILNDYQAKDLELYRNELHSHLGTELDKIEDAFLEQHYQQYFRDRQQVVAFAQQSSQVIKTLEAKSDALKAEIEQLETELEQVRTQIEQAEEKLERSAQNLDVAKINLEQTQASAEASIRRNEPGASARVRGYEREQDAFNRKVDRHNRQVQEQRDRVDRFNQKVGTYQTQIDAYNQVAQESIKVLESLQAPIPTP